MSFYLIVSTTDTFALFYQNSRQKMDNLGMAMSRPTIVSKAILLMMVVRLTQKRTWADGLTGSAAFFRQES